MRRLKSSFVSALKTQHTYLDRRLLEPVFCFEELVENGLWGGLGKATGTVHFSAQTTQEEIKCTKAKV